MTYPGRQVPPDFGEGQYPHGQPPSDPRSGPAWSVNQRLLIAMAVAVTLALGGVGIYWGVSQASPDPAATSTPTVSTSTPTQSPTATKPSSPQPSTEKPTTGPGDGSLSGVGKAREGALNVPIIDKNLEFTVLGAQSGLSEVPGSDYTHPPEGQYVVVSVTIRNPTTQPLPFDHAFQQLIDSSDARHSISEPAMLGAMNPWDLRDLAPNEVAEGLLVFDVPVDCLPKSVLLFDGRAKSSDGVFVPLS